MLYFFTFEEENVHSLSQLISGPKDSLTCHSNGRNWTFLVLTWAESFLDRLSDTRPPTGISGRRWVNKKTFSVQCLTSISYHLCTCIIPKTFNLLHLMTTQTICISSLLSHPPHPHTHTSSTHCPPPRFPLNPFPPSSFLFLQRLA